MPSERGSSSGGSGGLTSKTITRRISSGPLANSDVLSKTKHEEWTTSKKVVNHKTKQVETRVQRQIVMEDGKVIADSGPQVTTKTTEDNKTEETENTQHKKNRDDEVDEGYAVVPGSARVICEKTETRQTMKESKEESRKMHDESLQDLSGLDYHQKALIAPGDFGRELDSGQPFQGKLTHFSSKSQKITDKEEIKEISEQHPDGEVTTNTTRTNHHEEIYDDEVPETEANLEALPDASAKRIEYRKTGDNFESLSDKLRREKQMNLLGAVERRDAVTKKALSVEEEEEIRNCETNRWLEDHFGSDSSDIVETTKTKAGGNVINIQMSSARKASAVGHDSQTVQVNRTTSSTRINDLSVPKMTRFSTTREPDVVYTTIRTATPSSQPSRSMGSPVDNYSTLSSKTPKKTYYLGQDGTYNSRFSPPKYESTPLRKSSWKSTPSLNEDRFVKTTETRFVRNDESRRERSPVQRSMSQRDVFSSRTDAPYHRPSLRDDSLIHKVSSHSYYQDSEPSWKQIKTLPRDTKFTPKTSERHRHQEYSEVQSFRHGNKTDRSIQVVLSDDDDTTNASTLSRRLSPSPIEHVVYARPKPDYHHDRPSKQFYFGEGSDAYRPGSRMNGTSEGYSSLPSSNRYSTLEREDSIDRRFNTYSPLDRSTGDSAHFTSDRYTRNNRYSLDSQTYKPQRANNSFDSGTYVNTEESSYANDKNFTTSANRRQYIDSLLSTSEDHHKSKRSPERRQRTFYTNVPPSPPNSPPSSPPPRLIRADRFGGSSSLSPPDSPVAPPPPPPPPDYSKGSWSKSKGRPTSPVLDPPSFKPLLSPVEIKNMANSFSRASKNDERKLSEAKANGKGTVVVQIRDWGNR